MFQLGKDKNKEIKSNSILLNIIIIFESKQTIRYDLTACNINKKLFKMFTCKGKA